MLILLSDVNSILKIEAKGGTTLSNAVQGNFVLPNTAACTAGDMGFQIWTESDKDANGAESGWTPDFGATGSLTLLCGTYRAKTDCVHSGLTAVTPGDPLAINAAGDFVAATVGTDQVIAHAIGIEDGVSFKGSSYDNVLEYITV